MEYIKVKESFLKFSETYFFEDLGLEDFGRPDFGRELFALGFIACCAPSAV